MAALAARLVERELLDPEVLLGHAYRAGSPGKLGCEQRYFARRERVGHSPLTCESRRLETRRGGGQPFWTLPSPLA